MRELDCVVEYEVSLEDGGARVTYLSGYVAPQEIADYVEEETWFTVGCIEPEELSGGKR